MSDQSNVFKKPLQTRRNTPPLREFVVGAPEPPTSQFNLPTQLTHQVPEQPLMTLEEAQAASKAAHAAAQQSTVPSLSRQRIEMLSDIGRLTRDVTVGDHIFSIRTLKNKEIKEASMAAIIGAKNDMEAGFESRRQQLARAVFKIDGFPVDEVLASQDFNVRLDLIDDLEEPIANKLWDELFALKQEVNTKFGLTSQKNVEEVAADLKK